MADVIVIGGGLMGSATAWRLAVRGADVVLLEQFEPGHDRGSSYGSSRIFRLAYPVESYVRLAADALELWRSLESTLGTSVLTMTGAVDHGPEQATLALATVLQDAGHHADLLTPVEAARRWPGLRFDTSVLFHPEAGRLHADRAVRMLQQAAVRAGAEARFGVRVERVEAHDDHASVTLRSGEVVRAPVVVVAAGGWLPTVFGDVFDLPPLRVTQEQPVHFPASDALTGWPSFIHHPGAELSPDALGGVYGLGSEDGVKVGGHGIGPLVDPDHRDRSIDTGAVARLVDYARAWLPGVDHTRPVASTCLYTTTPDHDFLIDRRGPLALLGGFSGHGFKFGPAIGELAARLVLDGAAPPDRFRLDRPAPAL